jgi:sec-independent protein translocase protein TatA
VRMPGMGELLIILVIVLLVFGANKLPQLGDGIGKAIKNFKRGINHDDEIDVTPSDRRVASDSSAHTLDKEDPSKPRDAEMAERKS